VSHVDSSFESFGLSIRYLWSELMSVCSKTYDEAKLTDEQWMKSVGCLQYPYTLTCNVCKKTFYTSCEDDIDTMNQQHNCPWCHLDRNHCWHRITDVKYLEAECCVCGIQGSSHNCNEDINHLHMKRILERRKSD